MRCPHCQANAIREIKTRPRGTRYRIGFDCKKCGRCIMIEGVSGQVPPKLVIANG